MSLEHLNASLRPPQTWVCQHKLPSVGNYETVLTVCRSWKQMPEDWHLCIHLFKHKYIAVFQTKKENLFFPIVLSFLVPFLFDGCFVFETTLPSPPNCPQIPDPLALTSQIQGLEFGATTMISLRANLWVWTSFLCLVGGAFQTIHQ